MTTDIKVPDDVLSALRRYERILITAHTHPDGDAMGSCLALAWALRDIGVNALIFNEDGVPGFLHFLSLPGPVLTSVEQLPCDPQLIVVLDCGDRARVGEALQPLLDRVPTVNIDHHLANPNFGTEANWVVPSAAATGELVGYIIQELGTPLQGATAQALYVALSTDTGNFSYGNTTPGALRLAATLREGGLDISSIREKLENNWSEAKLRLWGRLMSETRILEDGKLAVALVTRQLLAETGATREDIEGFVEQLRRLTGVRVAMLLREDEKDGKVQTKASLRSSGPDNVRNVAAQFGGGGHKNAAGATVALEAEKTLLVMQPYIRFVWSDR
ncbi:MAG: bifunctional oligoribonuclease/PAP phosphatase NrnA [Mailhella sp.]|nr:bifunctional oligoribonuclease/PAP phosphatase NrnA [Mailhella sp.]